MLELLFFSKLWVILKQFRKCYQKLFTFEEVLNFIFSIHLITKYNKIIVKLEK